MPSAIPILETQYFPAIGWWVAAIKEGIVRIDISENYNKRTLRNKTVLFREQKPVVLSVPLKKGKHGGVNIQQVEIAQVDNWQQIHLKSILSVYGKSPYFIHYIDFVRACLMHETQNLFQFNLNIISEVIKTLDLNIACQEQVSFIKIASTEHFVMRDQIKFSGQSTDAERLIDERMQAHIPKTHLPFLPTCRCSILDLIFYFGPETRLILKKLIA